MLSENQNKIPGWKARMDVLDALPAEPQLQEEALWEKLQMRTQKAIRKKIRWIYFAAAACILFFGALYWLPTSVEKPDIGKKIHAVPPVQTQDISSIQNPAVRESIQPIHATPASIVPKAKQRSVRNFSVVPLTTQTDSLVTPTDVAISMKTISTDTPAVLIVAAVPKKLKVVHLNTLNKPSAKNLSEDRDFASGRFRTRTASDNIVQIKITPVN